MSTLEMEGKILQTLAENARNRRENGWKRVK